MSEPDEDNLGRDIYVAAAGHDYERARRWMAALQAKGWRVSLDWTAEVETQLAAGGDAALGQEKARSLSELDRNAVLRSQWLWVLFPESGGAGVHTELGIAVGANSVATCFGLDPIQIVVSGAQSSRNIFCSLADRQFESDQQAFDHLTEW